MSQQPNTRATFAGIILAVIILIAGVWVFNRLDASQKAQQCAERRGTNCAVINEGALQRR